MIHYGVTCFNRTPKLPWFLLYYLYSQRLLLALVKNDFRVDIHTHMSCLTADLQWLSWGQNSSSARLPGHCNWGNCMMFINYPLILLSWDQRWETGRNWWLLPVCGLPVEDHTCLAEVDTTDLNQCILSHQPCLIQITLGVFHVHLWDHIVTCLLDTVWTISYVSFSIGFWNIFVYFYFELNWIMGLLRALNCPLYPTLWIMLHWSIIMTRHRANNILSFSCWLYFSGWLQIPNIRTSSTHDWCYSPTSLGKRLRVYFNLTSYDDTMSFCLPKYYYISEKESQLY
jgi:hypothetical protein